MVVELGAQHGEADAGVAAGGLDDGHAGVELSGRLGVANHAERDAVFDAAAGVERLELAQNRGPAVGR